MESYQWIHPAVALITLGLLAATALSKMRARKYFRLHYTLASSTVAMATLTFGLGVYTVLRVFDECDCTDAFPPILYGHLLANTLLLLFLFAQATMGVSMLLAGRRPRVLRTHRFNAKILLVLGASALIGGLIMVILLLV